MTKRAISILGAAGIIACVAYFSSRSNPPSPGRGHVNVAASANERVQIPEYIRRHQEAVATFLSTVATATPRAVPAKEVVDGDAVTLGKMAQAFEFVFHNRRSITRDEDRDRIFESLLQDPRALGLASRTLADAGFAEEAFGPAEKQAAARHYSVMLLAKAAMGGKPEPMRETINDLVTDLSAEETPDKGRRRDLEDLLISYVSMNSAEIVRDPEKFLTSFGYVDNLKRQFVSGLHFGLRQTMDESAIEAFVKHAIVERPL